MKSVSLSSLLVLCFFGLYVTLTVVYMRKNPHVAIGSNDVLRERERLAHDHREAERFRENGAVLEDAPDKQSLEDLSEREVNAVVTTWRDCQLLYFIHISKTGGTHLNHCLDALKEKIEIQVDHRGEGLKEKPAIELSEWLSQEAQSPWLDCVKQVKSRGMGQCSAEMRRWASHKMIVSSESSFKQFWNKVLSDEYSIGPELRNGTCFFSVLREPVSWMQSAYNHALRSRGHNLKWHLLHETNNFQSAYFEGIDTVAKQITLFSGRRVAILYEALKRLVELDDMPDECDPTYDGNRSNVHSSGRGYDASVDWAQWVHTYNSMDEQVYGVLEKDYRGLMHIVAPEGGTVGSVSRAAKFFDIVREFQWQKPPSAEEYSNYIAEHRKET